MATWTEDDLVALEAAIKSGVARVEYAGPPARSVTYHSLNEMRALRDSMRAEISAASGTAPTGRRAVVRSGFRSGGRTCFRRNE